MKKLAIIKRVGYGLRDVGIPCLWFETYISESHAALQVITNPEEIERILIKAKAYDVKQLEGMPCWVETNDQLFGGIIKFLEICKI